MNRTLLLAAVCLIAVAAGAADPKPAKAVKPDDVRLTTDPDHAEFCTSVGEVSAKSGWGGTSGAAKGKASVEATIRKRAAALGANVAVLRGISYTFGTAGSADAYDCSADALERQQKKAAEIARKAAASITCTAGPDCELRWARVTAWLQENSQWKFRNVTDTLITTEGPLDTVKPAFEVTKMPAGDGKTYRIVMRAFCGVENVCEPVILRLRASFYDALTAPIEPPPAT
jgi:hypothetical protein